MDSRTGKTEGEVSRELLKKLSESVLLVALTSDQLRAVARSGTVERHKKGQRIIGRGGPGDSLYLILEGKVKVSTPEETTLANLSSEDTLMDAYEGDFFGEMSVLDHEPRSADVVAVSDVEVFRIDMEELYTLFAESVDMQVVILTNMARTLSRRLRRANMRVRDAQEDRRVGGNADGM